MSQFDHHNQLEDLFLTRRSLLGRMGNGFAALGLMGLLSENAPAALEKMARGDSNPLLPRKPPLKARAKRVIFLFMNGGPSQVDTFDPKPMLTKYHGQAVPLQLSTERKTGAALQVALRVPASTGSRDRDQRHLSPRRAARGRPVRHPLDARRRAEPRAVADADELRRVASDPALRSAPGPSTASAPRTRTCPASSPCAPAATPSRRPRTGRRAFFPASSRAPTSTRSRPTSRSSSRTSATTTPCPRSSAPSSTSSSA